PITHIFKLSSNSINNLSPFAILALSSFVLAERYRIKIGEIKTAKNMLLEHIPLSTIKKCTKKLKNLLKTKTLIRQKHC
ncbi:MAG: hypothetical protein K2M17_04585, partial [Bacilli bacterium]|nr:hypothetical protein [Bacilli bacterium]